MMPTFCLLPREYSRNRLLGSSSSASTSRRRWARSTPPLADGRVLRLSAQGDLREVIRVAAAHDALNLVAHEPSLEEVFLRFYTRSAA
jgi:hypothetical protein